MNVNMLVKQRLLCNQHNILINSTRTGWFDKKQRKFFESINTEEEPKFFSDTQPNPLSDIEQRIEESKQKLRWRKPVTSKTTFLTEGLRFLAPERTLQFFEIIQRPMDSHSILESLKLKRHEIVAKDQRFLADRHRILGNDLATAHFLVARGGQVRFTRSKEWVKKKDDDTYDLPRLYDPEYLIDAIKCDNMELFYEGLENVRRLTHLKYISLRSVKTFDDWCMDRLCGNEFERLEILDVTDTSITANGLVAVPKLRSLKAIVLNKSKRSVEFELSCSLLEEVMPQLKILDSADVHDDVHEAEKAEKFSLREYIAKVKDETLAKIEAEQKEKSKVKPKSVS